MLGFNINNKSKNMKKIIYLAIISVGILSTGCYKVYTDPSAASSEQILGDVSGLISITVGNQNTYSGIAQYSRVTISGFATKTLKLLNPGNTAENDLLAGGGAVSNTNTRLTGLWSSMNRVIYNADNVLANSSKATGGIAAGLNAYAYLFKGMAVGSMANFWSNVPTTSGSSISFSSRADALRTAINWLKTGEALVGTVDNSFYSRVPVGIDLKNTFPALEARYYNMLGDNDNALLAANRVDLTAKSFFKYDNTDANQIFKIALSGINVYQIQDDVTFGLPTALIPNPADKRISFYTYRNAGSPTDVRGTGFFTSNTAPIPVYLPGEVTLIKAEAYARKGGADVANAVIELNKVMTKTAATDAWGLGAQLPAYTGPVTATDVLNAIYTNRRMELFMSGLELEDCRRFGRPGPETNVTTERNKSYYPYPLAERANNPNTPADPAF